MPAVSQHLEHVGAHRGAQRRVQRGERLVEQDDVGLDGQRAGQGDPLLLASGQLVRVAPPVSREAHELEQLVDPFLAVRASAEAERHVAADAEVREQGPLLGYVADAPVLAGDETVVGVVDDLLPQPDLPPVGPLEPGHNPQERRLAAPRCAEDRGERTVRDSQVHAA